MLPTQCQRCDAPLRTRGRGRPNRYCSTRCRVAAHRARPRVPAELARRRRWVRRDERKRPVQAGSGRTASATGPRTWADYADASASAHGVGLGYVLAEGDGVVCIDLDHCVHEGRLAAWAEEILQACPPTFVEVSPSGTGLHIWGRGQVGAGRKVRRGDGACIEVYGQSRYIAMTGRRFRGAPLELAEVPGSILTRLAQCR